MRRLAGVGDDAEHVLGRELEHRQPIEDFPVSDAHALIAAPRDAALTTTCTRPPGRALSDLWFPHVRMWRGKWVHARIREAARDWLAGHKPQGFLCWVVWDVDALGVGTQEGNDRVEVVSGVGRPVVGRNPVPPPHLFLAVLLHDPLGVTRAPGSLDDLFLERAIEPQVCLMRRA